MKKLILLLSAVCLGLSASAESDAAFDTPEAWRISNPKSGQKLEWISDYSPRLKVLKVTVVPRLLWYAEFCPKSNLKLADDAQSFKTQISWKLLAEKPDGLTQVAVRLRDSSGEVFQFPLPADLRSGQWAVFNFKFDESAKHFSWGGNDNKKIDFPVYLHSLIIDGKPEFAEDAVYYVCDLKIKKQ